MNYARGFLRTIGADAGFAARLYRKEARHYKALALFAGRAGKDVDAVALFQTYADRKGKALAYRAVLSWVRQALKKLKPMEVVK